MTISSTTNRISYACGGGVVAFPYTFRILDEDDLTVVLRDSSGTETTLVITADYSVSGVGVAGGGNVTTVATYAAGNTLVIKRELDILQETDYIEGSAFPANSHEDALDKLTMIAQQLDEELDRSIKLPVSSAYSDLAIPDPEALKYLRWNTTGDALENAELVILGDLTAHDNAATPHMTGGWYATNAATGPVLLATSAEAAAGNDASKVLTPAGIKPLVGYDTLFLPIGAFIAYGAYANQATITTHIYVNTKKVIDYAKFGYLANWEAIDLRFALGPGWDVSTCKIKPIWIPNPSILINSASTVRFGFQMKLVSDGASIDTNHATPPIYVNDTTINEATGTEYIGPASANVATGVAGSENLVDLRVTRDNTVANNATCPVGLTGLMLMMRKNQQITEW